MSGDLAVLHRDIQDTSTTEHPKVQSRIQALGIERITTAYRGFPHRLESQVPMNQTVIKEHTKINQAKDYQKQHREDDGRLQ